MNYLNKEYLDCLSGIEDSLCKLTNKRCEISLGFGVVVLNIEGKRILATSFDKFGREVLTLADFFMAMKSNTSTTN